jgi:uncharacterized membrane protein
MSDEMNPPETSQSQEEQERVESSADVKQTKVEADQATEQSTSQASGLSDRLKIAAAMGYIPFLCFVPLIIGDKSEFLVFHARQGIVITLITLSLAVLGPVLTIFVPFFGAMIALCLDVALALMIILGAWRAYQGELWELPVVGKYAKMIKL